MLLILGMGCSNSSTKDRGRSIRAILVGLDGSGKTTVLYRMALNQFYPTTTTLGFNVETIYHKGNQITMWDMGGSKNIRSLWKHYYLSIQGIIFVLDSACRGRMEEARDVLHNVLGEKPLGGVPVIILANKQDLQDTMTDKEILNFLDIDNISDRTCIIQSISAKTGEGLPKLLDSLTNLCNKQRGRT